jgi:hypothetical protein
MKFNEGIINHDFATNARELTFVKTQQKCKHGKATLFIHIWLWWCIGKLEIIRNWGNLDYYHDLPTPIAQSSITTHFLE